MMQCMQPTSPHSNSTETYADTDDICVATLDASVDGRLVVALPTSHALFLVLVVCNPNQTHTLYEKRKGTGIPSQAKNTPPRHS